MNKIICGPDNTAAFNSLLRTNAPGAHQLAKDLYAAGLITGLGRATLEIIDQTTNTDEDAPQIAATGRVCRECGHWQADAQGDGTGVGQCAKNAQPKKLKWPKQSACRQFTVKD